MLEIIALPFHIRPQKAATHAKVLWLLEMAVSLCDIALSQFHVLNQLVQMPADIHVCEQLLPSRRIW